MPLQSSLLGRGPKSRKRTCEQVVGPQPGAKGLGPGKIPLGKPTWSAQSLSQNVLVSFHSSIAYPGVLEFLQTACILRSCPTSGSFSGPWGISPQAKHSSSKLHVFNHAAVVAVIICTVIYLIFTQITLFFNENILYYHN